MHARCLQAPTCQDGVKNGNETSIDCGGPECAPCTVGMDCKLASDCDSWLCKNGKCWDTAGSPVRKMMNHAGKTFHCDYDTLLTFAFQRKGRNFALPCLKLQITLIDTYVCPQYTSQYMQPTCEVGYAMQACSSNGTCEEPGFICWHGKCLVSKLRLPILL
jgi:hypothetical protein